MSLLTELEILGAAEYPEGITSFSPALPWRRNGYAG